MKVLRTSNLISTPLLTEAVIPTVVVYMVLKRLMKPFNEWDAYKLGIISDKGEKLKHPISNIERESYTILDRFCCNLKRTMSKFIGQTKLMHFLTALYLLKDDIQYVFSNKQIELFEDLSAQKQLLIHNIFNELYIECITRNPDVEIGWDVLINSKKLESIFEKFDLNILM